jgi:hypothetical protein
VKALLRDVFCPGLSRVELMTEIGVAAITGLAITIGCWLA